MVTALALGCRPEVPPKPVVRLALDDVLEGGLGGLQQLCAQPVLGESPRRCLRFFGFIAVHRAFCSRAGVEPLRATLTWSNEELSVESPSAVYVLTGAGPVMR